ncbi:MAG: hypothetical protein M3220_22125, partial [Chloroflexota bacterium]|nr:hypothetical protein [Chloroflexota bacterium]
TLVPDALYYISSYDILEEQGLSGLVTQLRQVVRARQATVLVLDGLATAQSVAESEVAFKQFMLELQAAMEATGCTAFLLSQDSNDHPQPVHPPVDGSIELRDRRIGLRAVREVTVQKFRGSGYLRGGHLFQITDDGIVIYPRTETLLATPSQAVSGSGERLGFGIARLDEMLDGGLPTGSATMVLGAPGSGKTLLGWHFLAMGARLGQPGLHFGFEETPAELTGNSVGSMFDLEDHIARGLIDIVWQLPTEDILDILAERLLSTVRQKQVRRLFIDGLEGFQSAATYPERIKPFFMALANELRALGVTFLYSVETGRYFGPDVEVPVGGGGAIAENIILLRYIELRSRLVRLLSILKVRARAYDPTPHEFTITDQGIVVAETFEFTDGLSGVARPDSSATG